MHLSTYCKVNLGFNIANKKQKGLHLSTYCKVNLGFNIGDKTRAISFMGLCHMLSCHVIGQSYTIMTFEWHLVKQVCIHPLNVR